jgi:hypothetical protein
LFVVILFGHGSIIADLPRWRSSVLHQRLIQGFEAGYAEPEKAFPSALSNFIATKFELGAPCRKSTSLGAFIFLVSVPTPC